MTAEVSGVRTLLAGVLPGVVMTIFLVVLIFFLVPSKLNVDQKKVKEEENSRPDTFWKSLFEALPTMFAAPFIIGCMLTGVFSPTEAGAAGVFYMIFIGILHGEFRLNRIVRALRETFVSVSVILIIVTTGIFFTKVLTMEKLPILVSTYLLKISHNPVGLLLIINLMILIIGMFMESISSIVLLTPMLLPVANQIGVDPVHLGLILVLNLMIGMTTPPFGIGLYMVCEVGKVTPEAVIKELLPMYGGLIASLMMVTFLPALSLWIPKLFFG